MQINLKYTVNVKDNLAKCFVILKETGVRDGFLDHHKLHRKMIEDHDFLY
jgi:hypothetical protein